MNTTKKIGNQVHTATFMNLYTNKNIHTKYMYLHSPIENILIRVDSTVIAHGSVQGHFLVVLIIPQNGGKTKVTTNVVFDQLVRVDVFGGVLVTVHNGG